MFTDAGRHARTFFYCSICFDVYKKPKVLLCLHRFCETCLHTYIIGLTSTTTNGKRGFNCPSCREFIPSPNVRKHTSCWAALFKRDFLLNSMMANEKKKNEIIEENLKNKVQHPCSIHKGKDCDFYCATCSQPVCQLCVGQTHRECEHVLSLAEAVEDRRARLEAAQHDGLQEAEMCNRIRNNYVTHLERQKCTLEKEIKQSGQDVCKLVSSEEDQLLTCLHFYYVSLRETVSSQYIQFKESMEKIKNNLQTVSSKTQFGPDFDFLMDNKILKVMEERHREDITSVKQYRRIIDNLPQIDIIFRKTNMSSTLLGDIGFARKRRDAFDANKSVTGGR